MYFHVIYHVLTIYIFIFLCFKKVFEHVLKIEDQFSAYQAVIPNDCNTTEECKKVESMIMLMFEMAGNRQHFGHLLRNFVELLEFDSFNQHKNFFFDIYIDHVKIAGKSDYCEALKDEEKSIHQLFQNISKIVGFDDLERVSLYDVPGILANVPSLDELMNPNLPNSFYFSRCESKTNFSLAEGCAKRWNEYLQNVTSNKRTDGNRLQGMHL